MLFAICVGTFQILRMNETKEMYSRLIDHRFNIITKTSEMVTYFYEERKDILTYLLLKDDKFLTSYEEKRRQFYGSFTRVCDRNESNCRKYRRSTYFSRTSTSFRQ
ncbi:hypothetical protein BO219_03050 [Anoxybacillus kestanbolensis]|uniref:Uncharacterized protein n=1 Tax=Anoxybacillus kestanbolensis TaxID=227476 RepID=A0A1V3FRQ3_9BACL|nr:hypothetical protein [Anoxybacillus kestanbolensis]OOE04397.1 hypothetical protein BO219_03050 [Anoxybacillus kestanbolensis]